jgi:hypothetical protein
MRFRLRTLLIVLALGPPVLALTYALYQAASVHEFRGAGQALRISASPPRLP